MNTQRVPFSWNTHSPPEGFACGSRSAIQRIVDRAVRDGKAVNSRREISKLRLTDAEEFALLFFALELLEKRRERKGFRG